MHDDVGIMIMNILSDDLIIEVWRQDGKRLQL
jgi:DNA gyrase/topoisomerase IV subunit B